MFTLALIVHVLCIVLWIGGVALVTAVVIPAVRKLETPQQQIGLFLAIERRFGWYARAITLLAAISGTYMAGRLGLWAQFSFVDYWWLALMVAVWAIFTLVLFLIEPLVLDAWFEERAHLHPRRTFLLLGTMHWLLLILSLVTIVGGVIGSHGLTFAF